MKKLILSFCAFYLLMIPVGLAQLAVSQTDSLLKDTTTLPLIETGTDFYNYNFTYKRRLDSIQQTVPLSYNEYVQQFIDILSKQKERMGKMLGLAKYYFPIFEKALIAYQIPLEIKYLPIIESSMDPYAISRVGATGMWQFMFGTAKAYGLNMDNFVDERKDPIAASYAAAAYFRDAYDELGDWLLAIAAYNCGTGNVNRAIDKAGSRDFWEIRRFLPRETRDYVPAFIAALYVMKFADVHEIEAGKTAFDFQTDTVFVNHFVDLTDVSNAINKDKSLLFALNPSYKKKIVNGTELEQKRIVLPRVAQENYTSLYDVLNRDVETNREVILASTDDVRELKKQRPGKTSPAVRYHKVKPGQNLSAIADNYGVEVQDLKVWNNLKGNIIIPGQKLKISKGGPGHTTQSSKAKATYLTYKVKYGDTLSGIAEKYEGVTVSSLKKTNGLSKSTLRTGMLLKIRVM